MVTFRLLSGSGRYVVVQATGAGETVPSAGWWRVDEGLVGGPPAVPHSAHQR